MEPEDAEDHIITLGPNTLEECMVESTVVNDVLTLYKKSPSHCQ